MIRRACGRADAVHLYAYGGGRTVEMWWQQNEALLAKQDKLTVKASAAPSNKALAAMADRTLNLQCMVQDGGCGCPTIRSACWWSCSRCWHLPYEGRVASCPQHVWQHV